jgi:hypothetical protein
MGMRDADEARLLPELSERGYPGWLAAMRVSSRCSFLNCLDRDILASR